MFLSLYPTDSEETREGVVDAARALGAEVFTSLHIPESDDLASYSTYLADLHRREGLNFCADISPTTLQKLSIGLDDLTLLHEWGVGIVRIDFGFTTDQVRRIADDGGFRIAINASTLTQAELDALDGIDLVAWHNYYPRPETGLSTGFFTSQDRLLADRGCAIYSFFPGEVSFRAPLGLGLPTLEHQRHRNAYVNHLELATLAPGTVVGCAEGTLLPHHRGSDATSGRVRSPSRSPAWIRRSPSCLTGRGHCASRGPASRTASRGRGSPGMRHGSSTPTPARQEACSWTRSAPAATAARSTS